MTLLFVEYIPQLLMGLAGLIFAAVALDFAWSRLKRVSQRLAKISRGSTPKDSGRGLTGKPQPLGSLAVVEESPPNLASQEHDICSNESEVPHESEPPIAMMTGLGTDPGVLVRDTSRFAEASKSAPLPSGADTERCQPVPGIVQSVGQVQLMPEPVPDVVAKRDPQPACDAQSLIARAMGELQQMRLLKGSSRVVAAVDEEVIAPREPSVRIVDTVVPGSERRVAM